MLPWSACSPALNPIEDIWDLLKRRQREFPWPHTLAQLERIIGRVGGNIAQATIQNKTSGRQLNQNSQPSLPFQDDCKTKKPMFY